LFFCFGDLQFHLYFHLCRKLFSMSFIVRECDIISMLNDYFSHHSEIKSIYSVEKFESSKEGVGIKINQDIPMNSFVIEYCGEYISIDEAEKREFYIQNKYQILLYVLLFSCKTFLVRLIVNIHTYICYTCR
jgi:hypothetical protein